MPTNREFCYVAKAPCGHYVAAVSADPEDFEKITAPTLREWKNDGLSIEQKPVSFVRSGGLDGLASGCDHKGKEQPHAH